MLVEAMFSKAFFLMVVKRINTKENSEKLGRLRQRVGHTEAQWKRRNIWCNTY